MISVLILTKNEELDLPGCLDFVAWSDDVHVFDSHSTDRTVEIAEKSGAKVTQREFDNYAAQRNAALHGLKFRHPWVLLLDADERVPAQLAWEIRDFVKTPRASVAAARLRRRDYFMGTWLKHAQLSPFFIRLVRPERVWYEREVNEVIQVDGAIVDLRNPYDHFPFSKGLRHWIEKHNVYSTLEAKVAANSLDGQRRYSLGKALWAGDFNERRVHQKGLFLKMPFRPFIKFFYLMIVRRAFLDGRAGITYAVLQSIYEYFIVLKLREVRRRPNVESKMPRVEQEMPAEKPGFNPCRVDRLSGR